MRKNCKVNNGDNIFEVQIKVGEKQNKNNWPKLKGFLAFKRNETNLKVLFSII